SEQKKNGSEAVEELQYRCSLKMALDILNQIDSSSQMAPGEGANPKFSRENNVGCPPSTPSRSSSLRSRSKKLEPKAAKGRRKPKNNCGLKDDPKPRSQCGSVAPKGSGKALGSGTNPSKARGSGTNPARGSGTNPARCGPRDLCVAPASDSPKCRKTEPKSSPRQRKTQLERGNGVSCKPKAGKRQQGRKRGCGDDSPQDQAQLAPQEASLPVPSKSVTEEPPRKTGAQAGRTLLGSSCGSASDELEKSISSESESLAEQLDGRRKAEGGEQLDGAGVASGTDRKCRNHPGSSPGPSDAFPEPQEEENKDSSLLAGDKAPDSEEDEGGQIPGEGKPSSLVGGMLVWCKLRRYPYWPAVVKTVKRKHRRACVLFIDGTTNEKKKGFSVSLKSLKHFDCEEKQELIERAKENYSREIQWCLQLILDYRIRVGCHSFSGSFLEYFAADISYPVRKEGYQSVVQMAFPNTEEEGAGESSSDTSPQKPPRKLLPDRTRAARDRENKKLVEFIVKTKGAEEHLLGILKSGKQSRWLKKFLNSSRYMTCVETYLEDEEQLDLVVDYLKEVYREMDTRNLHQILGDGIRFISDVLLPEAIICAIAAVDDIDYEKAEEKYIKGPPVSKR
ncbi:MUM1 protein, partial [Climacteris rufus]|nr:MUM1 protein [Climacteris rufus]